MRAEQFTTEAGILSWLEPAAEQRWGADRRRAMSASLQRVSQALATVASFSLPADAEPFPTGPEAPRD